MSYQVLALKWRPRLFREMVGQEHVLKALINALEHNRLHHAYLFTGTRGVGKTTVARILAKCLNCDVGVSSEPCNECISCNEINEGRFVDMIEVDAASRTKVEDTRELLENVQYLPTRGRYKVYIIDEVHMLSNSSFNALLKTLEEPPPHVKFLLATTDPQKLPATVLSRCLQFNLKNMSAQHIIDRLKYILAEEKVPFEEAGLWQLGRAADGSMRDALSLADQAIAYGGGKITDVDIRSMLGTIDRSLLTEVLEGLVEEDGQAILGAIARLAEYSPDYTDALEAFINVLHRIAIAQILPESIDNYLGDRQQIHTFAKQITAEDIQLYYQIAIMGRRDLSLAPDPRSGFEMIVLRMLAFKPEDAPDISSQAVEPSRSIESHTPKSNEKILSPSASSSSVEEVPRPAKKSDVDFVSLANRSPSDSGLDLVAPVNAKSTSKTISPENSSEITQTVITEGNPGEVTRDGFPQQGNSSSDLVKTGATDFYKKQVSKIFAVEGVERRAGVKLSLSELNVEAWERLCLELVPSGFLQTTAFNCVFTGRDDRVLNFVLDADQSALYDVSHQRRLADLLTEYFQQNLDVSVEIGIPSVSTPAQIISQRKAARLQQAEIAVESDPIVQQLQKTFGAQIIDGSIKPID